MALSGFTSLGFQVLWIRSFSFLLGNTIYSLSAVASSMLLGFSIGGFGISWALKKYPTLTRRHWKAFAWVELCIGISSFITLYIVQNYTDLILLNIPLLNAPPSTLSSTIKGFLRFFEPLHPISVNGNEHTFIGSLFN